MNIAVKPSLLKQFPPMGVYETLFNFADATGLYMGDPGTHPWAQGFPLTTQLPGGPALPGSVDFDWTDLKYPTAAGVAPLREAIAKYYNEFYAAGITAENVAVFAGGRPALFAALAFLSDDTTVAVEETEYTPYFDMLKLLDRQHRIVPSNAENSFRPSISDYEVDPVSGHDRVLLLKSNPCNPTGIETTGEKLKQLVQMSMQSGRAAIFDEAYEFFCDPPTSALQFVQDINETDIMVVGAATKGLQVPGMRVGWAVASEASIEVFRNFSSIGMGGVSRPAQIYVTDLLEIERVRLARDTVSSFYQEQRDRYRDGLSNLGFELFTGNGGFYHWGRLPGDITAGEFNRRLFEHKAGILPGPVCDMHRRTDGPLENFVRFSFGPILPETYEANLAILAKCV